VIQAIAAGRRAAAAIDRYLGGEGVIEFGRGKAEGGNGKAEGLKKPEYDGKREKGFAELERIEMPSLPLSKRRAGFDEVELGCGEPLMLAEVSRCLQCDLEIGLARWKRRVENGR
jgi:NADH-quinone oxidoreductase subunit F